MDEITVYKLKPTGGIDWSYPAQLLQRAPNLMIIEARFNRDDHDSGYVIWRRNDRFIEYFYANRWYNIFEVHDVSDDHLKGWYCNITRPAELTEYEIHNVDLALDVWVFPDGRTLTLDEDEFMALNINMETREAAREGLNALLAMIAGREAPFDQIAP
jgi:protein associated with RNAse G/E